MNKILTAQQVLDQQRKDHGMPTAPAKTTPATVSELDAIETFLTEFAGGGGACFFKFTKGSYTSRDGATIPCGTEFVVPYPATLVGWIRFNGEGNKPTRHMGKLFEGFLPPARASLGDDDQTKWDIGLDGKAADPWMMQMLLPLIEAKTNERHVFQTTRCYRAQCSWKTNRRLQSYALERSRQLPDRAARHFWVSASRLAHRYGQGARVSRDREGAARRDAGGGDSDRRGP